MTDKILEIVGGFMGLFAAYMLCHRFVYTPYRTVLNIVQYSWPQSGMTWRDFRPIEGARHICRFWLRLLLRNPRKNRANRSPPARSAFMSFSDRATALTPRCKTAGSCEDNISPMRRATEA